MTMRGVPDPQILHSDYLAKQVYQKASDTRAKAGTLTGRGRDFSQRAGKPIAARVLRLRRDVRSFCCDFGSQDCCSVPPRLQGRIHDSQKDLSQDNLRQKDAGQKNDAADKPLFGAALNIHPDYIFLPSIFVSLAASNQLKRCGRGTAHQNCNTVRAFAIRAVRWATCAGSCRNVSPQNGNTVPSRNR